MRHRLFLLFLTLSVLLPTLCSAQLPDTLFLHFDAADYPVTPHERPEITYSERLLPGTGYTSATDFDVRIEYPVFASLSNEEQRIVHQQGWVLPETITPECLLGTLRGQQQLDISFCPLVLHDGKMQRLTSCKIVIREKAGRRTTAHAPVASTTQRYAGHSVLAQGRWVKISVTNEGMYELTASKLQEWGFSDMSRVKLYGYGGRILPEVLSFEGPDALIDDLNEIPLYRKSKSLLFYAEGPVRWDYDSRTHQYTHSDNYYSSRSYYFLTEGPSPLTIGEAPAAELTPASPSQPITTVMGHALYDGNSYLWYNGGRRLFDSYDFATGNRHSFRLDAPEYEWQESENTEFPTQLTIAFSASSPLSSTTVSVALNDKSLGSFAVPKYGSNESARVALRTFSLKQELSNLNTIVLTTNNTNSARLDYLRLSYPRVLSDRSGAFSFVSPSSAPAPLTVCGADAGTQVWELPHGKTPLRSIKATLKGALLTTEPVTPGTRLAVVNINRSYPTPTFAGIVDNQDLHADSDYDMVIVVPSSGKLAGQAERLAQLHVQKDSLHVKVAHARNIYNEFSSGTPDATAIRRYLKMLYDRAAETGGRSPRYLLLMGNGMADNRMLLPSHSYLSHDDYLLCYEKDGSENSIGELYSYCTDDYFGLMDDGEGSNILTEKIDLGIGRLCCTTENEARIIVDKIERYLSNSDAGAWKNEVLFMGDYGDNNSHMQDAERAVNATLSADSRLIVHKVYPDAYNWATASTGHTFPQATRRMEGLLRSGVSLVNYSGHGSPNQLSHAFLTTTQNLSQIQSSHLPLWLLASCEIAPIDSDEENMASMSLLKEDGGAIAFICATRSVYGMYNNPLNCAVSRYLLSSDERGERLSFGEALMRGKCDMISSRTDNTMNKLKYVLLGDPALLLATPRGKVVLDSINGAPVDSLQKWTIPAGSIVQLSGHVDQPIDGLLTLHIYDCSRSITCRNNAADDINPYTYQTSEDRVCTVTNTIQQGHWNITTAIPMDISYSDLSARMVFYALSEDKQTECSGTFERFCLKGTDASAMADTIPPTAFLYFDNEEFPNGGTVSTNAILQARIADNYGINAAGSSLGHDMSLILDGDAQNAVSLNDFFTYDFGSHLSGHITYPMEGLAPGRHTLSLRVWDVCNNSTLTHLDFCVGKGEKTEDFSVSTTHNPVEGGTEIIVTLPTDHKGEPLALTINDATGRQQWSATLVPTPGSRYASVHWNASNAAGAPLQSGIYMLQAQQGKHHAKGRKIMVRRR